MILSKQPCPRPECGSSDAYHVYDDGHGFCFSCNHYFPSHVDMEEYSYEYLPLRGLKKETLKFYDIKTKINSDGKPVAVEFIYPNGAKKVRSLAEKKIWWDTGSPAPSPGLFGKDKFAAGSHKTITITEGEFDAASLRQVLLSPVVSVQSASTAVRDCAHDIDYLRAFDTIYIAFDNDAAGRAATSSVAKLFDYRQVYDVKFSNRKDANEYTQADEESVLRNIWWNSKRYLPEAIISSNEDFKKILTEPNKVGVPYPFRTLNEMTYGIRRGESVLITAQEGVGKTELMHAIEYQLLKETDDAIGSIFLEEPKKRHLQALAGLELGRPVHLPDAGVPDPEIYAALERILGRDERLYLYSHFGSADGDVILDTVRFLVTARSCSFILFDHITMAVSGLAGEEERRALDYIATRLEMMVKELNFSLIIVSHVNDQGLTRGSRYISKVADIRIDASRPLLHPDPIIRNTTDLIVSKNRFCGRTGPAGQLLFDPVTGKYMEAANDNTPPPLDFSKAA